MVPAERLELPTYRLQGGCSTNWAKPANGGGCGIWTHDPLLAGQVLSRWANPPIMAVPGGIEPPSLAWQASVITTGPWNHLAARAGFEPTNVRVKVWCVTISPSGNIGADRGNRTLVNSLEGYSSTIKLHLHKCEATFLTRAFLQRLDSVSLITYTNHRIVNPCRFLSILTAIAGGHVSYCPNTSW